MLLPKILLIDDEEDIVRVLSMSLKSDGYDVVSALSGKEGLDVFKKESPDIILTDVKMPGMDGIEVLKKVKKINPETEVIIITGHGDIDTAIEALQYGASDFVNKPVRDEALSIALDRAKEKIDIRLKLKEYTDDLENMVKIATEEVKRKSDFQTKLIKSSNDGIVATDDDWKIVVFNPGAERIFGYSRSEVIGKMKVVDLYPPEIVGAFKSEAENKRNNKELPWREITVLSKDGKNIPVRFTGTVLYEEGTAMGSVAFFQDLREIKRLEKELINSERLAAVGQTVAGLAHYIKNILIGLKGGSYIVDVALDKNDTDKLKNGWQAIKRNIGRISDLVLDLLTYSKEREPEYENCPPNEIVNDVCELVEATAREHHIEIIKDFDLSIHEVLMDPRSIHRSLLNLVSNAIDACTADEDTSKKWQVHVKTVLEKGNIIRFDVKDNGSGMSDEVRENLFESFFSTKKGKGTGLGLLVTRKLIEEHKGKIDITSELGKGTTFTIRLPYKELSNTDTTAT
ncbi:MAG: response regulator [Deltaproteobacteria bacterium]|nr:response regulator [Deltaproteobacteria bacterium]